MPFIVTSSKGNVLYTENNLSSSTGPGAWSGGANDTVGPEGQPLCFIKYLLGKRCVEMLHNQPYTDVTANQ